MMENTPVFYVLLISFISICITQLNIVLWLFIEELYSPLEAERTLPFIESSEPIWGIIAWWILAYWATSISPETFFRLIFWLLVFLMFLLSFTIILNKIPKLISRNDDWEENTSRFKKMKFGLRSILWMRYLKWLALVVVLQFALFNLIEYQYTSALDMNITASHWTEQVNWYDEHWNESENEHSYSSKLAHWLWFWHVLFSVLLLLSQAFMTSRITAKKWIIETMRLHPLLMLVPWVWMLSYFSLATAVISKASFEVLWWIHRTAYHSSFYAIKPSIREHVKEFLEWIARPVWLALWTCILLLLTLFFNWKTLHTILSIIIIILIITMIMVLTKLKRKYTAMSKRNAQAATKIGNKIEAIEVLTQRWHKWSSIILGHMLKKETFPELKSKLLKSLSRIWSIYSIPDIIACFNEKSDLVKISALSALMSYKDIWKNFFAETFAKHSIATALKELIKNTDSREIKSLSVKAFTVIKDQEIAQLLIKSLENAPIKEKADIIYIFKFFNDLSLSKYIEKYLKSNDVLVKSSVIITLWQFISYRLQLSIIISNLLRSESKDDKLAAIYILWETNNNQEIRKLLSLLSSDDLDIAREAAISLLKLWNVDAMHHILDSLLHEDKGIWISTKKKIKWVSDNLSNHLKNLLINNITKKLHTMVEKNGTSIIEDFNDEDLEDIIHYYTIIDEDKEVIRIKYILNKRNKKN